MKGDPMLTNEAQNIVLTLALLFLFLLALLVMVSFTG